MATLKDKIENALNETRILVLGIQILVGFAFRTFFEPRFSQMAAPDQSLQLFALALMLLGLGILMVPVPYHRVVLHGRNTARLHRLATATITTGLLPFALAMSVSVYLALRWIAGIAVSLAFSGALLALILGAWYVWPLFLRRERRGRLDLYAMFDPLRESAMHQEDQTNLDTRVKQVLIECRVVLPGAQALLGFQLIIMWMTAFEKIPQLWRVLHLASLGCIAVCTILLVLPAAYHRIVSQGEDSETLHHVTGISLLWAMFFLALGICGDFYVAARLTHLGNRLAVALSCGLLLLFLAGWFGFSYWCRLRITEPALTESHLRQHPAA